MNFSKKRTCKRCQLEGEGCGVKKRIHLLESDTPKEPCFKPTTWDELKIYTATLESTQHTILKLLRDTRGHDGSEKA